jgi:hypothetical protein
MALDTISNFDCAAISTNSSNAVQICTEKLGKRNWYTKGYDTELYVLNHLIAKNFYNLFTPLYHEVTVIQNDSAKLLATSEINNYIHIGNFSCNSTGVYYGATSVEQLVENVITALIIDDWDVKGNIGFLHLGESYYGVKIDFDESFLRLLDYNITFQTFFKPAGAILKESCSYKPIIVDAIKATLDKLTSNYDHLLEQCILDVTSHFQNKEIYDLSVAIRDDWWASRFFQYHPIQIVTSDKVATEQVCYPIMAAIKYRTWAAEAILQNLHIMDDEEYSNAIASLSINDKPYEDYRNKMLGKQEYTNHDDL